MSAATIANAGLVAAILLNAAFMVGFVAASWWQRLAGLFILAFSGIIEWLMLMRLFSRLVFPLPEVFWAVGFWALAGVFAFLLVLLWRTHERRPWRVFRHKGGIMAPKVARLVQAVARGQESATTSQLRHPWRATLRTAVAVVVALASLLPVLAVAGGLEAVPAVGQVLLVAGAITRMMAAPGVDLFLRRFVPWLAPEPAAASARLAGDPDSPSLLAADHAEADR